MVLGDEMIKQCAWCGDYMGEIEPLDDKRITHGICAYCSAKVSNEIEEEVNRCPSCHIDMDKSAGGGFTCGQCGNRK